MNSRNGGKFIVCVSIFLSDQVNKEAGVILKRRHALRVSSSDLVVLVAAIKRTNLTWITNTT